MKKAILAGAVVLVAFAAGLAGTYVAMPMLAPDVVAAAQARADSSAADSLAAALPDSSAADSSATLGLPDAASSLVQTLKDSLQTFRGRLRRADEHAATLRQQAKTYRDQLATLEARRAQAGELSGSLTKMEERELSALLRQVNPRVLERLYMEATGRTRTRLLQAMPPSRAARFVNQLVDPAAPVPAKPAPVKMIDGAASAEPGSATKQAPSATSK